GPARAARRATRWRSPGAPGRAARAGRAPAVPRHRAPEARAGARAGRAGARAGRAGARAGRPPRSRGRRRSGPARAAARSGRAAARSRRGGASRVVDLALDPVKVTRELEQRRVVGGWWSVQELGDLLARSARRARDGVDERGGVGRAGQAEAVREAVGGAQIGRTHVLT